MKKLLLIPALAVLLSATPANAQTQNIDIKYITEMSNIEQFSDGSYMVTTIDYNNCIPSETLSVLNASTKTKTATKHSAYYNSSNQLLWKINLTASFSYNGSSSTCKSSSCSVSDIKAGWSLVSNSASKTNNKATGKVKMHQKGGGDVTKTITMTCSPTGDLK